MECYPYHRHSPVSSFGYHIKPYSFQQPYGEITHQHIDYSASPYQIVGSEQLEISPYGGSSSVSARSWTHAMPITPISKSNAIYLDQDGTINHSQYHPSNFPFRSASSPESKSISLSSIATALPTTSTGPDRVLPYPSTGRQTQGLPLLRSSESHSSLHSHSQTPLSIDSLPVCSGLMSTGVMSGNVKSRSDTVVAENLQLGTSYHSLPSNSESSQQARDSYSSQERLYPMSNNSTEELRYVTSPITMNNRKQSGTYSELNGSLSSPSSSVLTSGHEYLPLANRGYYPTPPMVTPQIEMQSHSQSNQTRHHSLPSISAAWLTSSESQ